MGSSVISGSFYRLVGREHVILSCTGFRVGSCLPSPDFGREKRIGQPTFKHTEMTIYRAGCTPISHHL